MSLLDEFTIDFWTGKKLRGQGSRSEFASEDSYLNGPVGLEMGIQWAVLHDKGKKLRPSYAFTGMQITAEFPPPPEESKLFWMAKVRVTGRASRGSADDVSLDIISCAGELPRADGEGSAVIGPGIPPEWEGTKLGWWGDTRGDGDPNGIFWVEAGGDWVRIPPLLQCDESDSMETVIVLYGLTDVPVPAGRKPKVFFVTQTIFGAFNGRADMGVGMGIFNPGVDLSDLTYAHLHKGVLYAYYPTSRRSGGCFISEAVCRTLGKADDCQELSLLRTFRDKYVRSHPGGDDLIKEYYTNAPILVTKILAHPNSSEILADIYDRSLRPIISMIQLGKCEEAIAKYRLMYEELMERFVTPGITTMAKSNKRMACTSTINHR